MYEIKSIILYKNVYVKIIRPFLFLYRYNKKKSSRNKMCAHNSERYQENDFLAEATSICASTHHNIFISIIIAKI